MYFHLTHIFFFHYSCFNDVFEDDKPLEAIATIEMIIEAVNDAYKMGEGMRNSFQVPHFT